MATLVHSPGQTTNFNMGLGKFETRLGDDVLTSGFARELEHYQNKANPHDQQKCAQLLASLHLGGELHRQDALARRPKTAMAALGNLGVPDIKHVTRPYETTHQREYVPRPDADVRAVRPMTSQGFTEPDTVPQAVHNTHYDDEFCHKNQRPASPYRSGTSSGNRNNKPHPPKSFMVWKFPSKRHQYPDSSPWSEEMTNEKLNQVTKRLSRSTYQNDYLGIPQGFQVKSAYAHLPPDWRERVPYTVNTFQRSSFRNPHQQPEHVLPVNRYGSNQKKHLSSVGVIPTANTRALDIRARTTYDRMYNDTAPEVALQARDVSRFLVADSIRLQHEKPFAQERLETPMGHYEDMRREGARTCPVPAPPRHKRSSGTPTYRAHARVPEATAICYGNAYDTFQYKLDKGPTPPPSHISVPYSPPLFLG
ncbi:uncharacterized protein [Littorina saxatilis]|uniref:Uncharacterized protein n=1 Tax=Littorina saxatilis TaxID=31220 RepID=A0AAN9B1F1_9CAEN